MDNHFKLRGGSSRASWCVPTYPTWASLFCDKAKINMKIHPDRWTMRILDGHLQQIQNNPTLLSDYPVPQGWTKDQKVYNVASRFILTTLRPPCLPPSAQCWILALQKKSFNWLVWKVLVFISHTVFVRSTTSLFMALL